MHPQHSWRLRLGMFEKLGKLNREYVIHAESPGEELSALAIQSLEGYSRSHPQPSPRSPLSLVP
jgi:beta-barrel assembly-enhancing protease